MKFIIGKKMNMSQVFLADGTVTPVTLVKAEPCVVAKVRTQEKDGYTSVQVAYGTKKSNGKSVAGQIKGLAAVRGMKEFRVEGGELAAFEPGMQITTNVFADGDVVKVTGISKGRGFAGVVKRHGFHGQGTSHGVKDQVRMPGSSGAGGNQKTFKGVKKPGRMGSDQVTISNLQIVQKDDAQGILYVKGALPGARNSLVYVYGEGVMALEKPTAKKPEKEVVETPVVEAVAETPVAEAPVAVEPAVEVKTEEAVTKEAE